MRSSRLYGGRTGAIPAPLAPEARTLRPRHASICARPVMARKAPPLAPQGFPRQSARLSADNAGSFPLAALDNSTD